MPGIVLTTDLSDESKRAFKPVRVLADKLGLQVTLVAVLEDLPFEPTGGGLMATYPDRSQGSPTSSAATSARKRSCSMAPMSRG
jgi:nucleotide-binding universal stress UspA family protein